jgi:penicillin-binding protein 1A
MKKLYWFFKFLFYTGLFFAVLGGGAIYYLFWTFSKDLPKLDNLKDYNPPVISEVFADDGSKIGEFWTERRILLAQDEIPKIMEQAIISSEDDRFFDHSGIDYFGIMRAMIENLKAGHVVQGGSTITQQVVKTFLLTKERTYERKIKEAILAKRIEENFTKQEILYLYLNQTYFGNRAYGIESAAQNYFHKHCKELNIAEAAMISGLAKAPSTFSPIRNFPRAKERQEYVIQRMYEEGYISEEQKNRAAAEPLKIYKAPTDKEYNLRYAPWFVEEVRRAIMKEYGDMVPYTRGLKIYTTVDLKAQNAAEAAVARGLAELHKRHGYAGPLKHLEPAGHAAFNEANHRDIFLSRMEKDWYHPMTDGEIAAKPTELDADKVYQALVTGTDKNNATVRVGKATGVILPRDFGWARPRSDYTGYYDNSGIFGSWATIFVRDPSKLFKVGDVIEVKKLDPSQFPPNDAKNYPEGQTYFSLEQSPQVEGALFSQDPWTGYVKAVVGGKNFEKSEFNRATQSERQTGSVFKALLYAASVSKGYEPETVIDGSPVSIPDGPGRFWTPHNYGGESYGPSSFRNALTYSINLVSVHIVLDIGTHYVTGFLRNLGITTPIAKVYSMALGANDMRLAEISHAFGVFPTGGILQDLVYVKKITDRFGNVVEENKPRKVKNFVDQIKDGDLIRVPDIPYDASNIDGIIRPDLWEPGQKWIDADKLNLSPQEKVLLYGKQIPQGYTISPHTAYTMVDVMQDVVSKGTAVRVNSLKRPVAGKTGTTNDLTDTWFAGYTPDLVAAVWVGYDENKYKVGSGEQGGRTSAPIFLYYMKKYLEGAPVKQFEIPSEFKSAELMPPSKVEGAGAQNPDLLFDGGENRGGKSHGADFFLNDI